MSETNIKKHSNGIYDSKVFAPLLISAALLMGLFQNCSSKFGSGQDPVRYQLDAQKNAPVIISENDFDVQRLEGDPLFISAPGGLFNDQGLTDCPNAVYNWSFLPNSSGATQVAIQESSSTLQIPNTSLADEGKYFLDVTCNSQNYSLGSVDLDVIPKLKLVNNNVSNQTINEGSPATLNAQFGGPTPISYQWYFSGGSGPAIALAGQTGQQLNISNAQISDQGDYKLVATSNEGGVSQTLTAGPGKLTVVPISSVAGNVSGTTNINEGQPISLISSVSGASNPQYQWYHNTVPINGAMQSNFEIPTSQISDAGVYSLVVTEAGQTYQIGSVNVIVSCAPGQTTIGSQCQSNSQTCNVDHGSGVQFLDINGQYGSCQVTSCEPGYVNLNNGCLPATVSCSIQNGTGSMTIPTGGAVGTCVVQSCDQGYININNKCQQQVCSVENGTGLIIIENGTSSCRVQYCDADYVLHNGSCVARRQSCEVDHGIGYRDYTTNGPGDCTVQSCDQGYVNINNSCLSRSCSVENGQGVVSLSSSGSVQCRAVSCNQGFFLSGNQCITQACTASGGTGYWTRENSQNVCKLTSCSNAGDVLINNQCQSSQCTIANGQGALALNSTGGTYCRPVSCNSGYVIFGNLCKSVDGAACTIQNGTGVTTGGGTQCSVQSCNSEYVAYNNQCVQKVQSCTVSNGVGEQIFSNSGPGICNVVSCNSGYVKQGVQCVPEVQSCFIQNGTGKMTNYSNGFGQCEVVSCNSGYGITITQQCLPLTRSCYIGSGHGVQHLTAYGYSACEINSCPSGQSLFRGHCRVPETLLCEPTDSQKNAHGGKVFGYIYSLLNHKYNASVSTATMASNRLNGHVYLQKMSFSGNKGYLRNVSNAVVRHPNGSGLKDWFGLRLHTRLLPPDGSSSGNYILGLASDDGSSLECEGGGTWKELINNNGGSSCGVIKASAESVYISRNKPMPVVVSYFQNSGGGRCLKLYYKVAGSSAPFREVSQNFLSLPSGTVNRCPSTSY